jgi:outer membrane protein assembly factor BamB
VNPVTLRIRTDGGKEAGPARSRSPARRAARVYGAALFAILLAFPLASTGAATGASNGPQPTTASSMGSLVGSALLSSPAGAMAPDSPGSTASLPGPPDAAAFLGTLPFFGQNATELERTTLAQLAYQGIGPADAVLAQGGPLPPGTTYRDAHLSCAKDAAGNPEVITNDLNLNRPPDTSQGGLFYVRALSSANGTTLWEAPGLYALTAFSAPHATYERLGDPVPGDSTQSVDIPAGNASAGCDVLAIGFAEQSSISVPPPVSSPSVSFQTTHLRLLDGRTGAILWDVALNETGASERAPFVQAAQAQGSLGVPSGVLLVPTSAGLRVLLKTSDVVAWEARDPLNILPPRIPTFPPLAGRPMDVADLRVVEHLTSIDATSGRVVWTRDLPSESSGANMSWFGGVASLRGNGSADVVFDQLVLGEPTGTGPNDPTSGGPLMRFGRGMDVFAIDASDAGAGRTLWTTPVVAPTARANPPVEESFETLGWTYSRVVPADAGGPPLVLASYTTKEEQLAEGVGGRSHFVLLNGTDGRIRWDRAEAGWGYGSTIGGGRIAVSLIDIPTTGASIGSEPLPQTARLLVLNEANGSTLWSVETRTAEASSVAYNLALGQARDALVPFDATGDGVLDPLTTAASAQPTGAEQILLALSTHTQDVRDAKDGSLVRSFTLPGPDGRALDCGSAAYVFIGGYARRFNVEMIDPRTGTTVGQTVVWNDPVPRAASSGLDLEGVGASCESFPDGGLFVAFNLEEYSTDRAHEVVPILARIDPRGNIVWIQPILRGHPASGALVVQAPPHSAGPAPATVAAASGATLLLGAAGGVASAAMAISRWRVGLAILLLGLALLVPAPGIVHPALAQAVGVPSFPPAPSSASGFVPPAATGGSAPLADPAVGGGAKDLASAAANRAWSALPGTGGPGPVASTDPVPSADTVGGGSAASALSGTAEPPAEAASPATAAPDTPVLEGIREPAASYYQSVLALGRNATAGQLTLLTLDYLYGRGLPFTDANGSGNETAAEGRLSSNASISFTYPIGDADGDGVPDLATDNWCMSGFCGGLRIALPPTQVASDPLSAVSNVCYHPHALIATSGANGSVLWAMDLDMRTLDDGCGAAVVMGTIPTGNGSMGFVVYKFYYHSPGFGLGARAIFHEIDLVDARTGKVRWAYTDQGVWQSDLFVQEVAKNWLEIPIIEKDRNGKAGLFIEGQGFVSAAASTLFGLSQTGFDSAVYVLDDFQPVDWAARLDPATGRVLWKVDTFLPDPSKSALPIVFGELALADSDPEPLSFNSYWNGGGCCVDARGDGVPDLVYRVYEWTPAPTTQVVGPHMLSSRVVVLAGTNGAVLLDKSIETNISPPDRGTYPRQYTLTEFVNRWFGYELETMALHEANGRADLVTVESFAYAQYREVATAWSASDGHAWWTIDSPREFRLLPVGAQTGGGVDDFLYVDWYGWEQGPNQDRYVQPDRTPVSLIDGLNGTKVWTRYTEAAPIDVSTSFAEAARNGIAQTPDESGIFLLDSLATLDDLTTVHELTAISLDDGDALWTADVVGAFATPSRVPDAFGPGHDGIAVLSGDASDLWLTLRDAKDGAPAWSQRILALGTSGYASALPYLVFQTLGNPSQGGVVAVNFQLDFLRAYTFDCICFDGNGATISQVTALEEQMYARTVGFDLTNGTLAWSYGAFSDGTDGIALPGDAPGAVAYHLAQTRELADLSSASAEAQGFAPAGLTAVVGYAAGGGGGFWFLRRRKLDLEVPDLV